MEKVLKAKMVGEYKGKAETIAYRAVLYTYESSVEKFDGRPGIFIERQVESSWVRCPSGWLLDTLLGLSGFGSQHPCSDRIALDFGQGWFVTGMHEATKEAING